MARRLGVGGTAPRTYSHFPLPNARGIASAPALFGPVRVLCQYEARAVNRSDASRLVKALREVREDRGASPNEARVAAQKAAKLVERFGLENRRPSSRPRRPATPPPHPSRGGFTVDDIIIDDIIWMPDGVFANMFVPDWEFDPRTGEHSENVRVVHYENIGNWKIEVGP